MQSNDAPIHQQQVKAVKQAFHGLDDFVQAWDGMWVIHSPKVAEAVERKLQENGRLVEWHLDAEINEAVPKILSQRLADTDQEDLYWAFFIDGVSQIVEVQRSDALNSNVLWCASYSSEYERTVPAWFEAMFPGASKMMSRQPRRMLKDLPGIQLNKEEADRFIAAVLHMQGMKLRKFYVDWKFAGS